MERRRAPRHRTFKGGTISFVPAGSIDCVVRNISTTGACLELAGPAGIPHDFMLVIKPECLQRSCHMVWCEALRMGVRFG
jgi:PilZ domain-containing protein